MRCSEAFFLIQRHYDHELALEEQKLLDNHLLTCEECQREFDEYGELFGDIDLLAQQVEHRDVLSQTLHRLEEAKQKRRMDMWWRGVAVAASIVVIASTAFLTLTDSGRSVRVRVASLMHHDDATKMAAQKQAQLQQLRSGTDVEDNAVNAQDAITKIRQVVPFPLLELQDTNLQLVSTSLYGGDDQALYEMVELEYAVKNAKSGNTDKIYFLATPDESLKTHAKTNIGAYEFHGELQAGPFKWARVGSHALTAEINGDFYQIYSPFLQTNDLAKYAASIKMHRK